jgi:uncharacterized phage protein (predicted DNA packaging)
VFILIELGGYFVNEQTFFSEVEPQYLTFQDLKSYLRIDFDDPENDAFIETILIAAKSMVQTYLGWNFVDRTDVPKELTIAILAIGEHWYKNRGILSEDATSAELPFVFTGILDMHRNWHIGVGE